MTRPEGEDKPREECPESQNLRHIQRRIAPEVVALWATAFLMGIINLAESSGEPWTLWVIGQGAGSAALGGLYLSEWIIPDMKRKTRRMHDMTTNSRESHPCRENHRNAGEKISKREEVIPKEEDGVLPIQELREAINRGGISSPGDPIPPGNLQPASLDLRLGAVAHRLRCSFLPHKGRVSDRLEEMAMDSLPLERGAVLEVNRPYLIPLLEGMNLPPDLRARANPRSSTGRLDIFTRVITDHGHRFDDIPRGHQGPLYLEVVSRSFTVRVQRGASLNQIRLIRGDPRVTGAETLERHRMDPLTLLGQEPVPFREEETRGGLPLSVDLKGTNGVVGYRVRRNSGLVDLAETGGHEALDFWEPIRADRTGRLVLEPEEFYILASLESVRIPPDLAAEMVAMDPESGEFRTHYAGFFDPGFGYDNDWTHAVMEVRAHDVPFMLEHGQPVCRLRFERLLETPEITYGTQAGSSYQGQGLRLSRHFRP